MVMTRNGDDDKDKNNITLMMILVTNKIMILRKIKSWWR